MNQYTCLFSNLDLSWKGITSHMIRNWKLNQELKTGVENSFIDEPIYLLIFWFRLKLKRYNINYDQETRLSSSYSEYASFPWHFSVVTHSFVSEWFLKNVDTNILMSQWLDFLFGKNYLWTPAIRVNAATFFLGFVVLKFC